jgi:hypothetical protein
LGDRGARGQGRKVEAHEPGLVAAPDVANLYGYIAAQWLQGILIISVGIVRDIECEREGGTRQRTDERRAQSVPGIARRCEKLVWYALKAPLFHREMNCTAILIFNI